MSAPRDLALAVCLASLFGCGARTELGTDEAGAPAEGCPRPAAVRGVVARGDGFSCSLEGRDATGTLHRVECELVPGPFPRAFGGCRWLTEGEVVCECDEPDWASSCSGGVPLCSGWNRSFDFARDVEYRP